MSLFSPRCMVPAFAILVSLAMSLGYATRPALAFDDPKKPADAAVEGDLKTLQGEWISKDDSGESTWTFKGDKLHLKTPTREYEMTIKLDPAAKPEKTIDFNVSATPPNSAGTKALGIYKADLEKGKLQICFGGGDAARPTEFKMEFPSAFLFELKKKN